MKHVFVSPHPDDVALSCGGLVARLLERDDEVTILTVFSGPGELRQLTPFQRLALGFGSSEKRQPGDGHTAPEDDHAVPEDDYTAPEAKPAEAAVPTPARIMAVRRREDMAYGRFIGAAVAFVYCPDAVFRGYEGDDQLMGAPRANDPAPERELRRALIALEPDRLYLPFAIGGHVDHRLTHRAGLALLAEPGSPFLGATAFYEDFPYAHWSDFQRLDQLDRETLASLPPEISLKPECREIADQLDRKIEGLRAYESQLDRLFGGPDAMAAAVRQRAARVGEIGGAGPAERYWRVTPD